MMPEDLPERGGRAVTFLPPRGEQRVRERFTGPGERPSAGLNLSSFLLLLGSLSRGGASSPPFFAFLDAGACAAPSASSLAARFCLRLSLLRSLALSCDRSAASTLFSSTLTAALSSTSSSPTRSSTSTNLVTSSARVPSSLLTPLVSPSSLTAMPSLSFSACLASLSLSFLVSLASSAVDASKSPTLDASSGAAVSRTPTMSNSSNLRLTSASESSSPGLALGSALTAASLSAPAAASSREIPSSLAMSATVAWWIPSHMNDTALAAATRVSHCLFFRNPRIWSVKKNEGWGWS